MVPMEVINLDDTADLVGEELSNFASTSTPMAGAVRNTPKNRAKRRNRKVNRDLDSSGISTHSVSTPTSLARNSSKKRGKRTKKKLNNNIDNSGLNSPKKSTKKVGKRLNRMRSLNRLRELLSEKRFTSKSGDSDATLDGGEATISIIESPQVSNMKEGQGINNCVLSPNQKKRKRPNNVVVIDSDDDDDDDSVIVTKVSRNENNNDDKDVLYLSDNSVIELSDSEDVGVVAGTFETAQAGWKNHKERINGFTDRQAENCFRNNNVNIHVLRKKLRRVICPQNNQLKSNDDPGSSRQNTQVPKTSEQTSRHSISYLPDGCDSSEKQGPRPIVIDGSNVAFGHGKDKFSARGIEICVDFFLRRNHKEVRAFVPQFRRRHPSTTDFEILDKLEKTGHIVYTPSRKVEGKRITSYDDRYIVEYAAKTGGIIVTRDCYQDLLAENPAWANTINFRVLHYTFAGDMIMFPQDPLGRGGPTLDKFLKY